MEVILAIIIAIVAVAILGCGIIMLKDGINWNETLIAGCGVFLIVIVVLPLGYFFYDSYEVTHTKAESYQVEAYVTNKEYVPSYTTYVMSGKVLVPISHSKQYKVTFKYEDVEETMDNQQVYNQVKVNDKIKMTLIKYIKSNGKLYKQNLVLK